MKRDLILSDNQRYLKSKNPLLFIGEWCLLKHPEEILSKLDYKICTSHTFKNIDRKMKYDLCEKIFLSIIKDFKKNLNNLHQTSYSLRGWEIIAGEWLRRFIYICLDRFELLNKACKDYEINEIFAANTDSYEFSTKDTGGIYHASIDDQWNHALYSKILKFFKFDNKISYFETNEKYLKNQIVFSNFNKDRKLTKVKIAEFVMNIFTKFKSENDGFIFHSYLPFFYEKKLELSLKQFPQLWKTKSINFKTYNNNLRQKINFDYESYTGIEKFIRYMLPISIPICLIESFSDILHISNNNDYPKTPKFIFTSGAQDQDEIFKLYAANKVDAGVPFYIGQHGNGDQTLIDNNYASELNTCTKYLTWGMKKYSKDIPMFNFKTLGRKKLFKKNGYFTIIVRSAGYRVKPYDRYLEFTKNIKSTTEIIKKLNPEIKKMTLLRLHHSFLSRGNLINEKYFKNLKIKMDFGRKNLRNILKNTRVTLFNYDSTGLLENLALNIPSVCYWDDTYNHLNPEFANRYNLLVEAKILFTKREDLIKHLNNYWNNINDWWLDSLTEKKIKEFNDNFNVRGDEESFKKLLSIFKESERDDIYPLW